MNGHTKLAVTTSPSPNIDVAERTYANLLEEQILQYNQQTIVGPCLPFCALVQQQVKKKQCLCTLQMNDQKRYSSMILLAET